MDSARRRIEPRMFTVAALYHFTRFDDPAALKDPLMSLCLHHSVKGTLLLAHEGINGTIAGPETGIQNVLTWIRSHAEFTDLDAKFSWAEDPPFYRMKVRLKKEIVTLGVDGVDAANNAGTYVDPKDWNALISEPDVIVVDTRNDYEVAIGTFKNAQKYRIVPHCSSVPVVYRYLFIPVLVCGMTTRVQYCTGSGGPYQVPGTLVLVLPYYSAVKPFVAVAFRTFS